MSWNTSFDAMVSADLDSSFFGESEFADSVVFQQRGRSKKTIICRVVTTTKVIQNENSHQTEAAVISVTAREDAELGILNPTQGDYILWNHEHWDYLSVVSGDLGTITAIFKRAKVTQHGSNRPPAL